MFDSLNDPNLIPTQAATIGYMLKYGKNNIDDKAAIQIFNIFQKSSRILDESTKVWLGNSLMMALEHTSDKVMREMLKTCLPFTMILHLRCKDSSKAVCLLLLLANELIYSNLFSTAAVDLGKDLREVEQTREACRNLSLPARSDPVR